MKNTKVIIPTLFIFKKHYILVNQKGLRFSGEKKMHYRSNKFPRTTVRKYKMETMLKFQLKMFNFQLKSIQRNINFEPKIYIFDQDFS